MSEKLDSRDIFSHLKNNFWKELVILPEVDSTNLHARHLAGEGKRGCYAVTAECQTAGRGRMQRSFSSPDGTGIYLSLCYDLPLPAASAGLITVYTACAVAKAVEEVTGLCCGIKWVNDLYLAGKKVCGILTEGSIDPETGNFRYFIVGIGINVKTPAGGFTGSAKGVAGSLADEMGENIPGDLRNRLLAAVMNRMASLGDELAGREYLSFYRERSILLGRKVTVYRTMIGSEEHYRAEAVGFDDEGHLLVRDEQGNIQVLSSGEVSVKASSEAE